jgi:hypothetical protein
MLAMLASASLWARSECALAFCRTTNCACSSSPSTCAEACPLGADGCPAKGEPLAWSGRCVGYSLDVAGTDTLTPEQWTTAIQQAFETWASADCGGGNPPSLDLLPLRDLPCKALAYDPHGPNANVVYFQDKDWSEGDAIDGTLALTTIDFSSGSTDIGNANIALNSSTNRFTVGDQDVHVDLVSVVTHEVGHFLGIAHSTDPVAVMYPFYSVGAVRRSLSADDAAAVCAIYPPNRAVGACDPTPPGGLNGCDDETAGKSGCAVASTASGSAGDVAYGATFALAIGLVALIKRRGPP